MLTKNQQKYLSRNKSEYLSKPFDPEQSFKNGVVVPVLAENDYIFETLESLSKSPPEILAETIVLQERKPLTARSSSSHSNRGGNTWFTMTREIRHRKGVGLLNHIYNNVNLAFLEPNRQRDYCVIQRKTIYDFALNKQ